MNTPKKNDEFTMEMTKHFEDIWEKHHDPRQKKRLKYLKKRGERVTMIKEEYIL